MPYARAVNIASTPDNVRNSTDCLWCGKQYPLSRIMAAVFSGPLFRSLPTDSLSKQSTICSRFHCLRRGSHAVRREFTKSLTRSRRRHKLRQPTRMSNQRRHGRTVKENKLLFHNVCILWRLKIWQHYALSARLLVLVSSLLS